MNDYSLSLQSETHLRRRRMKNNKPKYNQIIEAAVNVIAENGYHGSQVSKISKAAGVADGTIYLYFKNKEDVLVSVFEEKMGEFIKQIEESTNQKQNANEKLFTLIKMHFEQLSADYHLAIVTQLELRQSNYDLRIQINNVLKRYLTVLENNDRSLSLSGINGKPLQYSCLENPHGQKNMVDYSPWGCKKSDMTE